MNIPKHYLDTLKRRNVKRATSERQELIQQFVDKINLERVGTTFKPATWKQVNGLVAHLKESDLYWFCRECEKAESFSKKFFGVLKSLRSPKKPS